MSDDGSGALGPSPEHVLLQEKLGEWEVDCTYFISGTEPMHAKGTDRIESLGPFWTVGSFHCELPMVTIHGRSVTGFDSERGCYLGTWHDSTTPFFFYFEGSMKDGVLEMTGDNIDPMTRRLVQYRSVEEFHGPEQRRFSLFVDQDGKEVQILRYDYSRKN